jgi:hypothetical protein
MLFQPAGVSGVSICHMDISGVLDHLEQERS